MLKPMHFCCATILLVSFFSKICGMENHFAMLDQYKDQAFQALTPEQQASLERSAYHANQGEGRNVARQLVRSAVQLAFDSCELMHLNGDQINALEEAYAHDFIAKCETSISGENKVETEATVGAMIAHSLMPERSANDITEAVKHIRKLASIQAAIMNKKGMIPDGKTVEEFDRNCLQYLWLLVV